MATLVLVEGDSDAGAVREAARLLGCDLAAIDARVQAAGGITNFPRELRRFIDENPAARFCGLFDAADERHVRRALRDNGVLLDGEASLEAHGFLACDADLEDELIRALGPASVERVIEREGEIDSFRRFQAMPEHRGKRAEDQLHRFLGTRATRKIRTAPLLVQELGAERLPLPLERLVKHLMNAQPPSPE